MGVKGWIMVMVLAATPVWAQEADTDFFGNPVSQVESGAAPGWRGRDDPIDPSGPAVPGAPRMAAEGAAPADAGEALGISPRFESNTLPLAEEGGLLRSTLRTITAVGFVLALIFGLAFFAKRYILKGTTLGARGKFIRVVDTLFLGPRKNLMVVEAFGDKFLLATVGSGVQFLSRVNEHRRETRPVTIEEEAPPAPKTVDRRVMGSGVPLGTWKKTIQEEIQRLKRQA